MHLQDVVLQPQLPEMLEALRDILRGKAWLGTPCLLAQIASAKASATPMSVPFSMVYMGPTGFAAYGFALSMAALAAALRVQGNPTFEIPEVLIQAASAIPATFVEGRAPASRLCSTSWMLATPLLV